MSHARTVVDRCSAIAASSLLEQVPPTLPGVCKLSWLRRVLIFYRPAGYADLYAAVQDYTATRSPAVAIPPRLHLASICAPVRHSAQPDVISAST
jgi:hypothetical protein